MATRFQFRQFNFPYKMGKRLVVTHLLSKTSLIFILFVGGIVSLIFTQIALLPNQVTAAVAPPPLTLSTLDNGNELVINTTNCKIPKFPVWSSEALKLLPIKCKPYFLGDPKCEEKHIHSWSYLNKSVITILYLTFNLKNKCI